MNTHQKNIKSCRLLVLVPHRDVRLQMQNYSQKLFSGGYWGAWSFPWVVPLAILAKPLNPLELKQAAALIREQGIAASGKITSGNTATAIFPPGNLPGNNTGEHTSGLIGPAIDLTIPDSAFSIIEKKVLHRFNPLIITAALMQNSDTMPAPPSEDFPQPPLLSFRAAALANMIYRPLSTAAQGKTAYSFTWKIGKLYWLPSR